MAVISEVESSCEGPGAQVVLPEEEINSLQVISGNSAVASDDMGDLIMDGGLAAVSMSQHLHLTQVTNHLNHTTVVQQNPNFLEIALQQAATIDGRVSTLVSQL